MTLPEQFQRLARVANNVCSVLTWFPPLLSRITIGVVFVGTGWGKLQDVPGLIEKFRSWGIPAPEFQAPFAAGSELVFGACVLIGLFTRFATIPLIIIMIVAMKTVAYDPAQAAADGTLNYLFGMIEYLYIVILVWLAIHGPGRFSVDHIFLRGTSGKV